MVTARRSDAGGGGGKVNDGAGFWTPTPESVTELSGFVPTPLATRDDERSGAVVDSTCDTMTAARRD